MASTRATTMPGGAKLRASSSRKARSSASKSSKATGASSRPCKYGPRDEDGYCPKKPKAPKKAKKPCKYGPRDAQGYCPKKPSSYSPPTPGGSTSVLDKKIKTRTSTGRESSTTIRKEANRIGGIVATQVGNKAADATWEWLKKPENRTALQTGAITLLSKLRALSPLVAALIGGAIAGVKIGQYSNAVREQGAQNFASLQIANVTRLAKRALTLQEAKYLRELHAEEFRKAYDAKLRAERTK